MDMKGQLTDPKAALTFALSGKAYVTLVSLSSGNRYTYRITAVDKRNPTDPDTWFVSLLNGPDNVRNYTYIGIIRNNSFIWTKRSHVSNNAPSVLGMTFVIKSLAAGNMNGFEFWHEGRCGRCGKLLTVEESIAAGYGPNCINKVGIAARMAADAEPVTVSGSSNLNFDGSERTKEPVTVSGTPIGESSVLPNSNRPALLDDEIRRRIAEYKANGPENYYQDGELDEKQAFNIAYNKFRVQVERESV